MTRTKSLHTRKNSGVPAKWLLMCSALIVAMFGPVAEARLWLRQDEASSQEDEDGYATRLEEEFDYINAFLAGFRSTDIIPSAQNCTKYLEESITQFNNTQQSW